MKFSIKDFSSKCDQIRWRLRIWSHLLKKSLMETFIFCVVSSENQFISIAPGDNVIPESLLNDKFCEDLSHPLLFPPGKFVFQFKRKVELSPTKYFNERLLNYTQKLSSDYIFFAYSLIQNLSLSNHINIGMRKVASNQLTADMLKSNFN